MQRESSASLDDMLTQRVEDAVLRALTVHGGGVPGIEPGPGDRLSYSMEEAATMLGVGRTAVYDLARTNDLKTFKIGKRRLVTRDALIEFLEQAQAGSEP
jgi:excisionase family DNA binding protein